MQLLIQQPEDPIVFIKQCVQHIVRKRDIPRVILIAPPSFGNPLALQTIIELIGQIYFYYIRDSFVIFFCLFSNIYKM